jgi:argininosuccinate lyase
MSASTRLWDKGEPLDARVARFTVGRDPELDGQLIAYDALASAAHATMLRKIGVLGAEELSGLLRELASCAAEARRGEFGVAADEEDGHTALENRLTARLGDAGRRVHTGRSRNDQVIAALRLWARERLVELTGRLLDLVQQLLSLAEAQRETTMPGYTHTRQAMPSTLGHFFAAHAEGLLDALPWIRTAFAHVDRSPLGSASGYGVALPLDRVLVAELLGFARPQANTLAVQNDRGRTEYLLLAVAALIATDLGRLATDLIGFSSDELGYVRLAAAVTTGSSIMPQKRNPDVLELIRAQAARLRQRQAEVAAIYGGLASGYHRDLQLTKEPLLEGLSGVVDLVAVMGRVLETLQVDAERCRAALLPATAATDEVYRRVAAGQPFRLAYREVAADPAGAVGSEGAELWRARCHLGAPGALDLRDYRAALNEGRQWVATKGQHLAAVWALLTSALAPDGDAGGEP